MPLHSHCNKTTLSLVSPPTRVPIQITHLQRLFLWMFQQHCLYCKLRRNWEAVLNRAFTPLVVRFEGKQRWQPLPGAACVADSSVSVTFPLMSSHHMFTSAPLLQTPKPLPSVPPMVTHTFRRKPRKLCADMQAGLCVGQGWGLGVGGGGWWGASIPTLIPRA